MKSLHLATAVARHMTRDGYRETAVPGLFLFRASSATQHDATVYEPALCIVAQGAKEIVVGREPFRYDPSHFLLVSVDLPATSRVVDASPERPCFVVRIALDLAVIGELLADSLSIAAPPSPGRVLGIGPIDEHLLSAVERVVGLLDSPHHIRALAPLILREINYRLLIGPQGARLRQIATAGAPAYRISQAILWLKSHFMEPLSVESLAKRVAWLSRPSTCISRT